MKKILIDPLGKSKSAFVIEEILGLAQITTIALMQEEILCPFVQINQDCVCYTVSYSTHHFWCRYWR
jgi:hypothetical protein